MENARKVQAKKKGIERKWKVMNGNEGKIHELKGNDRK